MNRHRVMNYETVLLEMRAAVAVLTLNRPDSLNSLPTSGARIEQNRGDWLLGVVEPARNQHAAVGEEACAVPVVRQANWIRSVPVAAPGTDCHGANVSVSRVSQDVEAASG